MRSEQVHAPLSLSRSRRAQWVHRNLHHAIFEDAACHAMVGASSQDGENHLVIRVLEPLSIEAPLDQIGGHALVKNNHFMASRLVPYSIGSSG